MSGLIGAIQLYDGIPDNLGDSSYSNMVIVVVYVL